MIQIQQEGNSMKKQKLLLRLVIPMMLILFMLPPVSCLVFRHAAHDYAYSEAAAELSELQQSILMAVDESFNGTLSGNTDSTDASKENTGRIQRRSLLSRLAGSDESGSSKGTRTTLRNRNTSSEAGNRRESSRSQNENNTARRPSTTGAGSSDSSESQTGTFQRRPYRTQTGTSQGTSSNDKDTDQESENESGTSNSGSYKPGRQPTRIPSRRTPGALKDSGSKSENSENEESHNSGSGDSTNENTGSEAEQAAFSTEGSPQFELLSNVKIISTSSKNTAALRSSQSFQIDAETEKEYSDDTASPVQVREFLRKAGRIARTSEGRARMMIFSPELTLRYPYDEEEQASLEQLYKDISGYISENADSINTESADNMIVITSEGQDHLISLSEIPMQSVEIEYIAAYCPTEQMDIWVNKASMIVLIISSVLALIALIVLLMTVRSVTRPVRALCESADRIGSGDFGSEISHQFSVAELEDLRSSMNNMSDRLKRSDETQKNFFQNVSHELRNPLMSISGYAQGIEQGIFEHPEEVAHTILEESGRLTEIVSSLLTLSRMEAADAEVQLSDMDINDTIEECLDRVNGQAMEKNISLLYDEQDEEYIVIGDEELCEQVICNFLTNAVRYAVSYVEISVHRNRDKVIVSVADDGKGISPDDIDHVFERCYKGAGGNFGIGLAIAQTAAHRMKGEVSAANRPEGGAVFTLTLNKVYA